jgi:uncharacterized protein YlxP (DUF503 family)
VIHLELADIHSLKERRNIINSLKSKLKRLNVSVLDISREYVREADIAFVYLSHDGRGSAQYREKIERLLERELCTYDYDMDYEEL